jgi:PhnB protein
MNSPKSDTLVQPYLCFEGTCEAALDFYKEKLGAEVTMLMRFKDAPESGGCGDMPSPPPDKVMHASFTIGGSMLMASDGRCSGRPYFTGISLSLTLKSIPESERAFAALSEGGQVMMPLGKTFYSPSFGMVTDQFGVTWMVYVVTESHA